MIRNRGLRLLILALPLLCVCACTTTYHRDGVELPQDYVEAIEAETPPMDYTKAKIEMAIDSVRFRRGPELLRELQWLIGQKELAIEPIVEALPQTDARLRANLLYVLSFTRTDESTAALTAHLHHADSIVRYEAASGLLSHGDTAAVPVLIDYLESDDRRFRYKAIEVLRRVIGRDFDYEFAAPAEIRSGSVNLWRDWWRLEKSRLMNRNADGEVPVSG